MPDHAWAESNLTISVLALTQSRCGYAGTNHQMSHCHSSKIDISILMGLRCQLVQKKSDLEEKQQEGYNSISRFIAELSVRHLQRWSMFKKKKKKQCRSPWAPLIKFCVSSMMIYNIRPGLLACFKICGQKALKRSSVHLLFRAVLLLTAFPGLRAFSNQNKLYFFAARDAQMFQIQQCLCL